MCCLYSRLHQIDMLVNEVWRQRCALRSARRRMRRCAAPPLPFLRPGLVRVARVAAPRAPYLRRLVSGGPLALRRADGVRDAAVIFSRRLVALRVRPPRRVAFLHGARFLETPAAQQVSHLKHSLSPVVLLSACTDNYIASFTTSPVRFAER